MTPDRQKWIKEIHPELCFLALNGDRPLLEPKRSAAGQQKRRDLLILNGYGPLIDIASAATGGRYEDDVLDACAACWTAERISRGVAVRIPDEPVFDSRGLSLEMWR